MCGIFGYVGSKHAGPIILKGLEALEYRGYDSAGIFLPASGVIKTEGSVAGLIAQLTPEKTSTSGIGHTRWATHGIPSTENAHPHTDASSTIWLVHNGIIENYQTLKETLAAQGISFYSETDTEVLAKLIGSLYTGDLVAAVRAALLQVRGTYGLAVMSAQNHREIVVARHGSPIVLGLGTRENYIASDPSALLPYTKDVVYLEEGDVAVVTDRSYEVTSLAGALYHRPSEHIDFEVETMQKNGYAHFMLKEIFEAPQVIENTIRGRLVIERGRAKLGGLEAFLPHINTLERLTIVGCGSAYYAGLVGRTMIEEYAGIPVEVELGSELRHKRLFPSPHTALLAVSQSGETADTLAAIRRGKEAGMLTLGIINAVGSTIARETDAGVYNHAGPEVAVASTKAFISQLTVFALLTLFIGRERGMSLAEGREIATALANLPDILATQLQESDGLKELAKRYAGYRDMMYIGRKLHAPIAYEGSLKLKEVTYIHAEAYAGGELKHGSIAMLDEQFPVLALAPQNDVYEKMVSNIEEVRARKAPVLAIATVGDETMKKNATDVWYVPKVHPLLQPIVSTIPLQLLAYYIGVEKGLNVDRPRNLAKSVTVE
jgi:glutamine---fructose-6-phosphate transaminase (isomerizing)